MDRSANTGSVGARPRSAAYPDPSNPRPMSHKGPEANGQELGLELATGDRKEILQNGDESTMEKGSMLNNHRVNKDRGPSAKEQQVVDRLLGQGPKILFVSLKKAGADELYNAVPTSQKDRVCVYPINGERSLVKWANTINEYEAIDREISIVSTRRWFHDVETQSQLKGDLSQSFDSNFELDAPATLEEADSGPNDHDRSGSAVDCADGRGVGIAVPFQLGIPAPLARDPLATPDFEGTLLKGLSGQITAKDDSLSQSPSTPATLDIRPPRTPTHCRHLFLRRTILPQELHPRTTLTASPGYS
ncbi:hypothetical protein FA13DRAFT_1800046 [Coprinellus micaceus]|uniref:Uncharacterized protein n=1 Tax=Coprinellus micaceus TaxID=71717 RepID=A0A4Y7SI97_COPMI|nr:hypothetical protein FA13DRAFT_1800046 [Coprinellus micaceus]